MSDDDEFNYDVGDPSPKAGAVAAANARGAPRGAPAPAPAPPPRAHAVSDRHHDEEVELSQSADDSVLTPSPQPSPAQQPRARATRPAAISSLSPAAAAASSLGRPAEQQSLTESPSQTPQPSPGGGLRSAELAPPSPSPSGSQAPSPRGPYNPEALSRLDVSPEVQELFSLIARFKPVDIQLETKLVPFVPEFIPAVGEPDAFLKVPRPDGKDDGLGLTVVDEPGKQSDPAVLFFKLENTAKVALAEPLRVQSIEHAEKNPQKVASWIANMQEVHRQRPPTTVHFSQPMPDVEALMQVWPDEFESALKDAELPSADLDLSLAEYARVCCALLDIPVHGRLVESLHLLFTLYSEFRSNPHFQQHA